jgi:protein O-mannosyl-transferase
MTKHNSKGTHSEAVQRLESDRRPTRGGSAFTSLVKSPFRLVREGNAIVIGLLLFALVVWTFLPSLRHGFVNFDDDVYVYDNPSLQHGLSWQSIRWAVSTLDAGFWHPLTWLSLLLDSQLFGLRPSGYHLTSLLLHAANTVLLFVLFRRLTGATWRSAFVAALFALHPLHVEPVAWVAGRKDVLSTVFWMLALLAYTVYVEHSKESGKEPTSSIGFHLSSFTPHVSPYYLLSFFFFVCGLLSKTMVVTLPFILLLLDWWPLQRFQLRTKDSKLKTLCPLFLEKLPFLAAAFACGLLTVRAEKGVGAMQTISDIPLLYRIANATFNCGRYLVQMVWPSRLAVFYPYPRAFALWPVVGTGLLLLLASALLLRAGRRWPYLAFGWIWYGVTLLPVAGLIQVGSHSHADRYTYLPLIGAFTILAWGAYDLTRRWPRQPAALTAAVGLVLLLLVPLTRRQIGHWKDSKSLLRHALGVTDNNHFAHNNLGLALLNEGQADEAINHFQQALEIDPGYSKPHNNLGIALLEKGRVDEAIVQFRAALASRPDFAEVCYNLGVALLRKGQPQEAVAPFQNAVESRPELAKARYGLGSALLRTGRTGEAVAQFRKALELDPGYAEAHNDLGLALLRQGQVDEAIGHFQQALKLRPDTAETCYNLGLALVRKGRSNEAIPYLQKAVAIQPDLAETHNELANALLRVGKVDEAIVHLQKAVQANPKLANAHNDLAGALLRQGRAGEALAHYQAAIDAQPGNAYLLNNLAWVLATCPQTSVRNGAQALELAQQAERLSGGRNPSILGTLAAAYAETGRFPEAVTTAQRGLELAMAQTNNAQHEPLRAQLGLYRVGSPFRDAGQTNAALESSHSGPAGP